MPGPSTLAGTQFEIISLGDFEMLTAAFNGLASITSSDGFGNMMRAAFLVGILAFGVKVLLTGKFEATPVLASVILYFVMFVPKAQVVIIDAYSGGVRTVANVPVGLAAPFSLVSKTGRYFSQTFETAFSVIGPSSKFLGAGYLDALAVLLKMRDVSVGTANSDASNTGNLATSLQNYLVSCAMFDIELASDTNSTINPELLRKSGKTWDNLRTEFVNIQTTVYMPGSSVSGQQLSCRDAYLVIGSNYMKNPSWVGGAFDSYLKTILQQPLGHDEPASSRLQGALEAIGLGSEDAANYAINAVLYNALRKAEAGYAASNGDINASITISQAENQRNVQWTAEKTMFEKVARPVTAFIEVFLVAATPLMAFAIAAFGVAGVSTLGKFMMMHFWVTLWAPTLTIANMYTYTIVNRFIAYTAAQVPPTDPLSINGIDQITLGLQSQYATGCMLAAATPMLTLMLIYGSSQVASMLAHKMSSADQVDTKVASPPVVSPAALVQNQSGFTGNPMLSGGAYAMSGAGTMSTSISDIAIKGQTSAKQYLDQASQSLMDTVSSQFSNTSGANKTLSMKDGKTMTNSLGEQNVYTAAYNTARTGAEAAQMSAGDAAKFTAAYTQASTNSIQSRAGLMAMGMGAGVQFDDKAASSWASSHDLNVGQTVSALRQISAASQTQGSHAATLTSMVSKTGEVSSANNVSTASSAADTAAYQKSLTSQFQAASSYMLQDSYNRNIATASTVSPIQLLANAQSFASQNGKNVNSVLNDVYGQAFGNDQRRQNAELNKLMSDPMFQQNVSSGNREAAAKAWIIATNSDANATHLLMSKLMPVSEDMATRAKPDQNSGLAQKTLDKPTAVSVVGSANGNVLANGVMGQLQAANSTGERIQRQLGTGLPSFDAAKARVDGTSIANDAKVAETTKKSEANMDAVRQQLMPGDNARVFDLGSDTPSASSSGSPTSTSATAGGQSPKSSSNSGAQSPQTPEDSIAQRAGIVRPALQATDSQPHAATAPQITTPPSPVSTGSGTQRGSTSNASATPGQPVVATSGGPSPSAPGGTGSNVHPVATASSTMTGDPKPKSPGAQSGARESQNRPSPGAAGGGGQAAVPPVAAKSSDGKPDKSSADSFGQVRVRAIPKEGLNEQASGRALKDFRAKNEESDMDSVKKTLSRNGIELESRNSNDDWNLPM